MSTKPDGCAMFEVEDRWYHPDELRELFAKHRLVPLDAPRGLAPMLTGYDMVGLSDRDQPIIEKRLQERWAAIFAVLDTTPTCDCAATGKVEPKKHAPACAYRKAHMAGGSDA